MSTELGQAYVQIMPSAKGIKGSISKVLNPEANAAGGIAGKSIGSKMISVIKGAIITAGIVKLIGK